MTHFRRRIAGMALTALALALAASRGGAAEPLDEVKQMREDMRQMREVLARIESSLNTHRTDTQIYIQRLLGDVNSLKEDQARIQRELDALKNRPQGSTTSAYANPGFAAPLPPGAATPPTPVTPVPVTALSVSPTARVRLVNTYFAEMTAAVNGTVYSVPAFTERYVSVPAGLMTFQISRVAEFPQTRILRPSEELTLTIR